MLTLILLVVLGGGVGLLAVSMAERKPATNGGGSRRGRTAAAVAVADATPVREGAPRPNPEPETDDEPPPLRGRSSGPWRRRQRGSVPASQTAVEGRLADLVRPSIPRRVLSLVGLVVIVVVIGVGIAALLGAIVGGAAELIGNAI